jgi:hypothetical protein
VHLKAHPCAKLYRASKICYKKTTLGFINNAPKYKAKKRAIISFFEKFLFINENTIHYFIFFGKIKRGYLCKRNLPAKTLEWVDFFEETNLEGIIVGHIQICKREILGM